MGRVPGVSEEQNSIHKFNATSGPRERDAELSEVRQQLGALQAQVSRTMSAALARPTEPSHLTLMRSGDTPGEVRELRDEVDRLRSEIMRASSPGVPADPGLADLGETQLG